MRAAQMAAAGTDVTFLTVGEHDLPPSEGTLEALAAAAHAGHTRYTPISGQAELRDLVAKRITDQSGVPTAPENVLIVPGAQAGLFVGHMAVADAGDTGLIIDPYYATYPGTLRAAGLRPKPVAARPENGFVPDRAALDAAADGARTLLINSPNNPTGAVYGAQALDEIAEVVRDHNLWLISDEVYASQVWQGQHLSPRALPALRERTLVVGSVSKSHAMTGFRAGWVVGPGHAIDAMSDLMINVTYGISGFVQQAALYALNAGAALERKFSEPLRTRRDLAETLLAEQNTLRAVPAAGAMYVMLDVRATGLSGVGFAEALLEAERIAVMPGESFGSAAAGHIRIALSESDDRFAAALRRIIAFAERQAPR